MELHKRNSGAVSTSRSTPSRIIEDTSVRNASSVDGETNKSAQEDIIQSEHKRNETNQSSFQNSSKNDNDDDDKNVAPGQKTINDDSDKRKMKPLIKKIIILLFGILFCAFLIFIVRFLFNTTDDRNAAYYDNVVIDLLASKLKTVDSYVPRTNWGRGTNCSDSDRTSVKSKIRFVMMHDLLIFCSHLNESCDGEFERLYNKTTEMAFKDVYPNFLIGGNGLIYESRPFSCPFDEIFIPDDHSSIIVVGMGFCFSNTKASEIKAENEFKAVTKLIRVFQETGVFGDGIELEFAERCRNSSIVNRLLNDNEYTVSYYKYDLYLEISVHSDAESSPVIRFFENVWNYVIAIDGYTYLKQRNYTKDLLFNTEYEKYEKSFPQLFSMKGFIITKNWDLDPSNYCEQKLSTRTVIADSFYFDIDGYRTCVMYWFNLKGMQQMIQRRFRSFSGKFLNYVLFSEGYILKDEQFNCSSESDDAIRIAWESCKHETLKHYFLFSTILTDIGNYSSIKINDKYLPPKTQLLIDMKFEIEYFRQNLELLDYHHQKVFRPQYT